jgi:hypothetical protein
MTADLPIFHHYLPGFYLKRWADDKQRVCRYSKPHNEIIARMVSTRSTGGGNGLYSIPGAPAEEAQRVEIEFMKQLDTLASEALTMIETRDQRLAQPRYRSAWSRFIISLLLRMPRDIDALREGLTKEMIAAVPELDAEYQHFKADGSADSFSEFLKTIPDPDWQGWAVELLPTLIDHEGIGQMINNMIWFTRTITSDYDYVTSDSPVTMSYSLVKEEGYIFLPIGPKLLFCAVSDRETFERVEAYNAIEQLQNLNKLTIRRATELVFARDERHLHEVREMMGTRPGKTLLERLVKYREQKRGYEVKTSLAGRTDSAP